MNTYDEKVFKLFFTDPWLEQVRTLLQSYHSDVATLMDFEFDGELGQHDEIKQFKQLTHTFRTEVLDTAHTGLKAT